MDYPESPSLPGLDPEYVTESREKARNAIESEGYDIGGEIDGGKQYLDPISQNGAHSGTPSPSVASRPEVAEMPDPDLPETFAAASISSPSAAGVSGEPAESAETLASEGLVGSE